MLSIWREHKYYDSDKSILPNKQWRLQLNRQALLHKKGLFLIVNRKCFYDLAEDIIGNCKLFRCQTFQSLCNRLNIIFRRFFKQERVAGNRQNFADPKKRGQGNANGSSFNSRKRFCSDTDQFRKLFLRISCLNPFSFDIIANQQINFFLLAHAKHRHRNYYH